MDLYAPKANLVIELDVSQHQQGDYVRTDRRRDGFLTSLGLKVLRFGSREVLKESDAVVEVIYRTITEQLTQKSPLSPLFQRGVTENLLKVSSYDGEG